MHLDINGVRPLQLENRTYPFNRVVLTTEQKRHDLNATWLYEISKELAFMTTGLSALQMRAIHP
jgi:hypothetical protein